MDLSGIADCRGLPQMNRFLETCLLLLLTEGSAHGYALLERLPVFGFTAAELNASTLYRALRKLEADNMVASEWESGGSGPPRRVYALTEAGRRHLCAWVEVVRERRSRLEKLISEFERRFPPDGSRPCMEKGKQG